MKWLKRQWMWICLAVAGSGLAQLAAAPAANSEVIGQVHFKGFQQLSGDPNGRVFKEVCNLPATVQLRNEGLDRLARAMATHFEATGGNSSANCANLLRPLLRDLWDAEFYGEAIEHPGNIVEVALAVRLDDARRRGWESNWSQVLAGWKLRTPSGPAQVSFLTTNSWFVLRCLSGPGQVSAAELGPNPLLALIQTKRANAEGAWLRLDIDFPHWFRRFSHPHDNWPRMALNVTGRGENLRSEARLSFADSVVPRVEKWDLPVNLLRDPLISFTAVQGLAPWLKQKPNVQQLSLEKVPNQLFCWGLSQTPFQIQAAAPATDPTNAFQRIATNWMPRINRVLDQYAVGLVRPLTNRTELIWRGLPILVPYLEPLGAGPHGFLHGGIFPVAPPTNPPPQELIQQLRTQTNIVYYDWEITQQRLDQLRPLLQLISVFLTVSPMSTNSTASQWLDAIQARLGNTITRASVLSPRELEVVRTSHVGLNGVELLSLANWLEGTNFPRLNLNVRFRPALLPRGPKHPR